MNPQQSQQVNQSLQSSGSGQQQQNNIFGQPNTFIGIPQQQTQQQQQQHNTFPTTNNPLTILHQNINNLPQSNIFDRKPNLSNPNESNTQQQQVNIFGSMNQQQQQQQNSNPFLSNKNTNSFGSSSGVNIFGPNNNNSMPRSPFDNNINSISSNQQQLQQQNHNLPKGYMNPRK